MSDFNIKSFFKNRFIANNSLINDIKTGNLRTNQPFGKTEEKDEAVELEDDALKFVDLFNGNSFFDAQIPEKDLKPVPAEENNDTAKSDNGKKDTPDRSEELLKGPKISDTIDTIGNWRDWIKPALPADHVAWGNGQKDTPDRSEELLKGPKIGDTIGNWRYDIDV